MSRIIYEKTYPKETPEEATYEPESRDRPDMSFEEFMRRGDENRFSIPIPNREHGAIAFVAAAQDVSALYRLDVIITEHIDHICQLGGEGIVGFGSDFDGIECTPDGLSHPGEIPNLLTELRRRGYGENAIEGIAGKNLLAYYTRL